MRDLWEALKPWLFLNLLIMSAVLGWKIGEWFRPGP